MKFEYDRTIDAAYVSFSPAASMRQEKLDDARIIDYDGAGTVIGVEFLAPSRGLDLTGVPRAAEIALAARKHGLQVRAARSSAGS